MAHLDSPPLVSVILPTYNRAYCLFGAIQSVLNQTHANLELIVIDDGSTDDTRAVIARFSDPRLIYEALPQNRGGGVARNTGLSRARGDYVSFQDSDDIWLPQNLEMQLKRIGEGGFEACYGGKIMYGRDDRSAYGPRIVSFSPTKDRTKIEGDLKDEILRQNLISTQTLVVRRDILQRIGGFDEMLPCNQDWDLMIRLSQTCPIAYLDYPVCVALMSHDSISRNTPFEGVARMRILSKYPEIFARQPKFFAEHAMIVSRRIAWKDRKLALGFAIKAFRSDPFRPKIAIFLGLAILKRIFA